MCDLLGQVDVAADEGEVAAGADDAVQACAGPWLGGKDLADRRPPGHDVPRGGYGLGECRERAAEAVEVPPQAVGEQITCRWRGCRCPRLRWPSRRVWGRIQQRSKRGYPGDAVGDGVVHLDEHAHPVPGESRQERHFPQRPGPLQPPQLLGGEQKRRLVTRVRKRHNPHVIAEVERRGIHPQRPAQPPPGNVEQLPEPGHQVQPGRDHVPHGLDPEAAARVEQAAAVKDGEGTDLLRPDLIRPQHQQVFSCQPVHRQHPLVPRPARTASGARARDVRTPDTALAWASSALSSCLNRGSVGLRAIAVVQVGVSHLAVWKGEAMPEINELDMRARVGRDSQPPRRCRSGGGSGP